MTKLLGCGDEGSDIDRDPIKAYPLYSAIGHKPGMYRTGKIIGDLWMERYVLGGSDLEGNGFFDSGHRLYFDQAMRFYRGGGVARNEIRSAILRNLRKAEKERNQKAVDIAEKTLAETF